MRKVIPLLLFNAFLIGYGIIIAGFIGISLTTNNVDNISVEPMQGSTKEYQTTTLKAMSHAVLLYTDNNVPKSVLSTIHIEMKNAKNESSIPIKYEQVISGSEQGYYNQIATVRIPEKGKYLITVTIISEEEEFDFINPRVVFREGDMFERTMIVYFMYLIIFIPLVNFLIFKRKKVRNLLRRNQSSRIGSNDYSTSESIYCKNCLVINDYDSKYCFECGKT